MLILQKQTKSLKIIQMRTHTASCRRRSKDVRNFRKRSVIEMQLPHLIIKYKNKSPSFPLTFSKLPLSPSLSYSFCSFFLSPSLPLYPSFYLSINQYMKQLINLCIYLSIYLSLSIYLLLTFIILKYKSHLQILFPDVNSI